MAEIDRLLEQRRTEAMVAKAMQDSRSLWSSGTGAGRNGRATGKPPKGASGRAGKSDAQRDAEEAMRAAQALADAQAAFHSQLLDLQADMEGPVAAANREFEKQISELNAQFAEGRVTLADYAVAQELYGKRHEDAIKALNEQLAPHEQLIADMQQEITLLTGTNEQRIHAIALRMAEKDATAEQVAEIERWVALTEEAQRTGQQWADLQRTISGTIFDLSQDFGNAEKTIKSFFDSIAQEIASFIADEWAKQLKDALKGFVTSNEGKGGWGGTLSGILSAMGYGGAKASGGPVGAGMFYQVNEQGPELLSVGGRDFLMMGANAGRVTPNHMLGRGGGSTINQTFVVQGSPDRRTRQQMARESGRAASRAMTRTG